MDDITGRTGENAMREAQAGQGEEIAMRDAQAEQYDDIVTRTRGTFSKKAQFDAVMSYIDPRPGQSILDSGCGTGMYSVEMAARGARVHAVDFSARSVDILLRKAAARGISNIETGVGDVATCELPKMHFDTGISIEVLQHIPTHAKRVAALGNIAGALKKGGKAIVVVYRYGGWIKPPMPKEETNHGGQGLYRLAFTEHDGEVLFRDAGLKLREVHGILNLPRRIRRRLPMWASPIERMISALPISPNLGEYLLFIGTKD